MKARRKNSNDEWKEVKYVQLEGSDILFKQEYLEFDTLSTELKTNSQIVDEVHWQDVRERAAIAAMQGIFANPTIIDAADDHRLTAIKDAIGYADDLVKQLKEHNNETN